MAGEPTPEQIGRAHALQRLVEAAETLARTWGSAKPQNAADGAYTRSYAETCQSVADKLRKALGFKP